MTERNFTITLGAEERFSVLVGLGFLWAQLGNAPDAITKPIAVLIDKLTTTPGVDQSQAAAQPNQRTIASGAAPAHAILAPPEPTDYFARNRKGDIQVEPPTGAELSTHEIVGTAKTEKYLKVILKGKGQANCFDRDLWQMLENRKGQAVGLWIKPSEDGKYQNLVGVRA